MLTVYTTKGLSQKVFFTSLLTVHSLMPHSVSTVLAHRVTNFKPDHSIEIVEAGYEKSEGND